MSTKSFLKVCRQLNTKRSVKDYNEWTKMGSSSVVYTIQNPKSIKDCLTQEQSSSRGIARNRKWRRKADKRRGNRKPVKMVARSRSTCHYSTSMEAWAKTVNYRACRARDDSRVCRSKIVCQMREEQTGVTRRNHRRSTSFGWKCKICCAQLAN